MSLTVLVEENFGGRADNSYVYGVERLSFDYRNGQSGYYLYDPRGSVTGITTERGNIVQSYRYDAFGNLTFGEPTYENEYTYNGESYNPNIESQYLRARYYDVVNANFLTEDSYLGNINEPLTLNRYNYCVSSPLNYQDPSGNVPTVPIDASLYALERHLTAVKETGLRGWEAEIAYAQSNLAQKEAELQSLGDESEQAILNSKAGEFFIDSKIYAILDPFANMATASVNVRETLKGNFNQSDVKAKEGLVVANYYVGITQTFSSIGQYIKNPGYLVDEGIVMLDSVPNLVTDLGMIWQVAQIGRNNTKAFWSGEYDRELSRQYGKLVGDTVLAETVTLGTMACGKLVSKIKGKVPVVDDVIENSRKPVDVELKYKEGWTTIQKAEADVKVRALSDATTIKTPVSRVGTSASSRYKWAYGKAAVPSGYDVDHTIDLQLGGADVILNMNPLDKSVNRSLGVQIKNAIKDYPDGTIFGEFTIH